MRHARHDAALDAAEKALRIETRPRSQRYIVIVYDGPETTHREASYISNVAAMDVEVVCRSVIEKITRHYD